MANAPRTDNILPADDTQRFGDAGKVAPITNGDGFTFGDDTTTDSTADPVLLAANDNKGADNPNNAQGGNDNADNNPSNSGDGTSPDGTVSGDSFATAGPFGTVFDTELGVFGTGETFSTWELFNDHSIQDMAVFGTDSPANTLNTASGLESALSHGTLSQSHFNGRHASGLQPAPLTPKPLPPLPKPTTPTVVTDDPTNEPTNTGYDPMFQFQWYMKNTSGGVDINITEAWNDFTGNGVTIGIVDQGVQSDHPDLSPNFRHDLSSDMAGGTGNGNPVTAQDNHGTQVAGLAAAAKNGIGIQGSAYEAGIGSIRFSSDPTALAAGALLRTGAMDISSNSWELAPFDPSADVTSAMESIATTGRGGLGTVTLFCASNERDQDLMSNIYSMTNSPYAIVVGSVNSTGRYSDFSCAGPNLLVTATGEGVVTTDRVAPNGDNPTANYGDAVGTSFSTPLTAGVVALILQANPNLGYRDVQEILAYSSVRTEGMSSDLRYTGWQTNGTHDWNGGGLHTSHDYGFGLVDATAAVRLAESWDKGTHTHSNLVKTTISGSPGTTITDGATTTQTLNMGSSFSLQQAMVTVDISHTEIQNVAITLISPDGTKSDLFKPFAHENLAEVLEVDTQVLLQNWTHTFGETNVWTFKTVMPWGEDAQGDWTLQITDYANNSVSGTLNSWSIEFYGDAASNDDFYVYTNEFSDVAASDSSRKTLSDSAGSDTINAAAVSSASNINLTPGATSIIDGTELTIAAGTIIENAHTGDGNDTIIGNSVANSLFGWRGNDRLTGGGGNDSINGGSGNDYLFGGAGADNLTGGGGHDVFHYTSTAEGGDVITDFNHGQDDITFSAAGFNETAGAIEANEFFTSANSVNTTDACFIFESGSLYYDPDGSGAQSAIEIATITGDAVQADDLSFV